MNLRNPINTLSFALLHALEIGLDGVPSEVATDLLGPTVDGPRRRRPTLAECEVAMFCQSWRPDEMGFRENPSAEYVEGEVVVIVGPQRDACVYFACQFAYHLGCPNRRFFLDVAAHSMAPMRQHGRYDGRDDEEAESIDYSIEMQISLLHAVTAECPRRARAIGGLLQQYADKFRHLAEHYEAEAAAVAGPAAR